MSIKTKFAAVAVAAIVAAGSFASTTTPAEAHGFHHGWGLGAGLVGGVSCTAAINQGDGVRVYEAVYGATHEAVKPNTANPLPLILPAIEMLKDLGEATAAGRIQAAVETVLAEGKVRTADIGGTATTTQFTEAICAKL